MFANEANETVDALRQETERGECFALCPWSATAAACSVRFRWLELGRAVVAPGTLDAWESLEGVTISRTDVGDRTIRAGLSIVLARALDQLELPPGVALDFTGVPLSERALEAILRLADRLAPRGLVVIAEPLDAA